MKTRLHKKNINAIEKHGLKVCYWEDFDYGILKYIQIRTRQGSGKTTYSDCIIMADTETSKSGLTGEDEKVFHNHVCAWSIAFRAYGMNLAVLWGKKPSDFCKMLKKVVEQIVCDEIKIFWHNMAYDWVFIRRFIFEEFGHPKKQLNVKPLYPLSIRFHNGIHFLDSYLLSQRSIEKWGEDLQVEHKKAVGKWNYDEIRHQNTWNPSHDELLYMCNDVLCGVECIDATMKSLRKTLGSLPMTATGIVRNECRDEGRENKAHDWAVKILPESYDEIRIQEGVFHGGYTHGNRNANGLTWPNTLDPTPSPTGECMDFASSYPYCMLTEKMPCERFWKPNREKFDKWYVLDNMAEYAFIFKISAWGAKLKQRSFPMPVISYSKLEVSINEQEDNGRILSCDYMETWVNELDFSLIDQIYDFDKLEISELRCARKDYLPKWLTDYIYQRFVLKSKLKGGPDAVLYAIEKAKLNSIYGMSAQKCVKDELVENYETGIYSVKEDFDRDKAYKKYLNNKNTFLPYCIGIWTTSAAQRNLFRLGACVPEDEIWLYSDTDSVYATAFDKTKLEAYNKECMKKLKARGYGAVENNGKKYWLGVAEPDGEFMQFRAIHAKCYCKRSLVARGDNFVMGDDFLKITVAGVPKKKGAACLENHIENFKEGFLFSGKITKKLQHEHYFVDEIYIDENGNEVGDSINLTECDYIIKRGTIPDFDIFNETEVEVIDYEQNED